MALFLMEASISANTTSKQDILELVLREFDARIGPPRFIDEKDYPRFKYECPSFPIFQVLKAVRVVSGLYAATILLEYGHVIEMGVLFRTIGDFLGDILFAQEAIQTGTPTMDQQKLLDQFFETEKFDVDAILKDPKQRAQISRKSVLASQARMLLANNPDRFRKMAATLDIAYSMYVHGEQPTIMELYVGGDREGFHVLGMLDTPKIAIYRRELAFYTHRTLNVFAGVALRTFGLTNLGARLLAQRRALEASGAYR